MAVVEKLLAVHDQCGGGPHAQSEVPSRPLPAMSGFCSAYRVLSSPRNPTVLDSDYVAYTHAMNLARSAVALNDRQPVPRHPGG